MSSSTHPRWGFLAALSLLLGLILAVVLYAALPHQRWVAGLVAGIAIVDAVVLGVVLPNALGRRSASEQIDALNARAEAEARSQGDWAAERGDERGSGGF